MHENCADDVSYKYECYCSILNFSSFILLFCYCCAINDNLLIISYIGMSESNDKETTDNNSKHSYSHQLYLMIGQTNRRKITF